MRRIHLFFLMWGLLLAGCTASYPVRTVGRGNLAVQGNFGGPILTNLGVPIPSPNLFLGGRYGVREDLDVSADFNLTSPFLPGFMDLGTQVHWVPVQPGVRGQRETPDRGWSLGATAGAHWMTNFSDGLVVMPYLELAGGWRYKKVNPFLGASLALNFYPSFYEQSAIMLNPFVGVDLPLGRTFSLTLKGTVFDVTNNRFGAGTRYVYLIEDKEAQKYQGLWSVVLGFSWKIEARSGRGK